MLQNLGYIAEYQGGYQGSASPFTEGLTISRELDDKVMIAACLVGLGGISGVMKYPACSASLLGSAEALRETIGAGIAPGDQPDYERNLALAQSQLDGPAFQAAWAVGRGSGADRRNRCCAPGC